MKPILCLFALTLTLLLAACGNKGPLTLPQKPAPATEAVPEPVAEPVPAKEDGDGQGG